ncbi:hypothetical protein LZ480_03705 [Solibacillus sp. MA9]|uniref:ABC transporter permease n=1 Tax=Solibacillus palustris TaxID=2908203 RepID=A0ABS9U9H1_9BACL|nr:hypothetical protein [Solibacillus sp. MA9]MCH7320986.1 hypothetical protein [Solibacillus sp. MA9]
MTLFLTRYFLRELSAWVWFTPLAYSFILLLGAVIGLHFYIVLVFIIGSCAVVFSKYNVLRSEYSTTLTVAPLPSKTIVHADFTFLSWITFCYVIFALGAITLFTLLIEKEFIFPTVQQLGFIISCCLAIITLSIWILTLRLNTTSLNTLLIMVLFLPIFLTSNNLTLFASSFGLHFFFLMLVIISLSYFSMITLGKRRWGFK